MLVERFLRHLGNRCRTEDPGVEEEQVQRSEPRRHRRHQRVGVGEHAPVGSDDEHVTGQLGLRPRDGFGFLSGGRDLVAAGVQQLAVALPIPVVPPVMSAVGMANLSSLKRGVRPPATGDLPVFLTVH